MQKKQASHAHRGAFTRPRQRPVGTTGRSIVIMVCHTGPLTAISPRWQLRIGPCFSASAVVTRSGRGDRARVCPADLSLGNSRTPRPSLRCPRFLDPFFLIEHSHTAGSHLPEVPLQEVPPLFKSVWSTYAGRCKEAGGEQIRRQSDETCSISPSRRLLKAEALSWLLNCAKDYPDNTVAEATAVNAGLIHDALESHRKQWERIRQRAGPGG